MNDVNAETSTQPGDSLWDTIERNPALITILGSAAIVLITFAAFWTALRGDFIWDDDYYVTNNVNMQTWEGLKNIWVDPAPNTQYYPLTSTVFWIEHRMFGVDATGYHVVNVLLHVCGALLLWVLLRRLRIPGAWAAAAIFAVHPVQTESVAWITELKNILSGVFYFASMLVYLRYCELTPSTPFARRAEEPHAGEEKIFSKEWFSLPDDPTRVYALAIFLFACALLSKSVAASMPAAVLLLIWWKRGRLTRNDFLPLLPFFALGIGMSIWTGYVERAWIGATGPAWQYGSNPITEVAARCLIASRAVWFYALKLLVPYPLIFNYPRWHISAAAVWQYLFPLAAVAAVAALWALRRAIGRGPLVAVLFFVGTLVPALGFVNVYPMQYSFVADHFQYLACIGLIVLVVGALTHATRQLIKMDVLNPAAAPAAAVVLLGALVLRTGQQGAVYHDLKTLWEDTIKRTGGANTVSWFASNNYGVWLLNNGYTDAAERWFKHTLKLKPDHAQAYFNLGLIAERRGQLDVAQAFYQKSLALDQTYDRANFKLAELYARTGRPNDAIEIYRKLADANPDIEQFHRNLGIQLATVNQLEEAIAEFSDAVRISPDSAADHLLLADALYNTGRIPDAVREYGEVVRLDPKNAAARLNFGRIMALMGHMQEAAAQFKLATEYSPKSADAYKNLGMAYMQLGQYSDAVVQFNKVIEIAPNYPKAQDYLNEALDLAAHPEKRPATTRSSTQPATHASSRPLSGG